MKAIEVKNLTKSFKDLVAVNNISFDVGQGEIFAFLGPNGAGKSTTIKVMTTLLHPNKGSIILNGFDVLKQKDKVRNSFGIVFQDNSLDTDLTAYENMYFHAVLYKAGDGKIKDNIKKLLDMVDLWDKKDKLVKTFSGGMKRRLEIARGFLHHPKILFLDEPTLGLDPQTRNSIWEYIKQLNQTEKTTVFFTTHYMEEAEKMAKRIAIIDHGKIITIGTPKDIENQTNSKSLEEAFLKLTGKQIREEKPDRPFNPHHRLRR